jgi:hypothetical protein
VVANQYVFELQQYLLFCVGRQCPLQSSFVILGRMGRSSNSLTNYEVRILKRPSILFVSWRARLRPLLCRTVLLTFAMNRSFQHGDFNDPPLSHRQFQTCPSHRSVEAELVSLRSASAASLTVSLGTSRTSMDELTTCVATDARTTEALRYVYRPCDGSSLPKRSSRRELTQPNGVLPSTPTHSNNTTFSSTSSGANSDTMIPVGPGQLVRLRGADETWQAIQQDNYQPCICLDCRALLFCILAASFVLCPHCQVMSPLYDQECSDNPMRLWEGGVGLGFTIDALTERQASLWRD